MNGLALRELSEIHLVNRAGANVDDEKAAAALNTTKTLKQLALKLFQEAQSLNEASALDVRNGIDFYEEVKRFEVDLIQRALAVTHGHQRRAARLLKLKVTTLNSKIKHYNISRDETVSNDNFTESAGIVHKKRA